MIGAVLKLGLNMAAYSASSVAVREGAKWVSSNFRNAVRAYTKYAENSVAKYPRARQTFFKLNLESNADKLKEFMQKSAQGVARLAKARSTPGAYRAFGKLAQAAKDEVSFLPANYIFYKMEHHRAVSPEEKENTKSFLKYYFGAPMITSVAAGAALNNTKFIDTGTKFLAKKVLAKNSRAFVKGLQSTATVMNHVANIGFAASMTKRRLFGEAGMLGTMMHTPPAKLVESAKITFLRELESASKPRTRLEMRENEIKGLRKQLDDWKLSGRPMSATKKRDSRRLDYDIERLKDGLSRRVLSHYKEEMSQGSKVANFMNRMLNEVGDPSLKLERVTRKVGNYNLPEDYGKWKIGGKEIDFGRASIGNMRDMLINGATSGPGELSLRMFGQHEMVQFKHSEHALGLAFTSTRRGRVFLPMTYFDETGAKSAQTMLAEAFGMENAKGARREVFSAFYQSRISILQKEAPNIKDTSELAVLLKRELEHGGIPIDRGEMLIHHPGGAVELISKVKDKASGKIRPTSLRVGGVGNGQFMNFLKFTRDTNTISGRLMRGFLGYNEMTLQSDGQTVTRGLGPTPEGAVIREPETEGIFSWIKNKFDLGYSRDQSILSKLWSIFSKHNDPRYPTTFFSDEFIKSPAIQREIAFGNSNGEINLPIAEHRTGEVIHVLERESKDAMDFAVANLSAKLGRKNDIVSVMKDIADPIMIGQYKPSQYMISPEMAAESGHERIKKFYEVIQGLGKEGLDTEYLRQDLDNVRRIRELFHTGGGESINDYMRDLKGDTLRMIGGKLSRIPKIDEYNASVLRLMVGLNESMGKAQLEVEGNIEGVLYNTDVVSHLTKGLKKYIPKETHLSAFAAASHMSQTHHRLFRTISLRDQSLDSLATEGSCNKVADIIAEFTGHASYDDVTKYFRKSGKYLPFTPWDFDTRDIVPKAEREEIFLYAKKPFDTLINKKEYSIDGSNIQIAHGIMDAGNIGIMSLFHAFNKAGSEFLGIGLDEYNISTPGQFFKQVFTKRVVPAIGLYMGASVVDRLMDRTLDGTPFGEGLFTFGANVLAGARVAAQGMLDVTGVTGSSKYLEDLMPGFIESPASGLARGIGPVALGMTLGFNRMGSKGGIMGGLIGAGVGVLLGGGPLGAFGMWDIDKSREEVIDELTGRKEIAVRKGRWWELGSTPFSGTRIEYFRPHIYALTRSKYKDVPGLKDSIFSDVVGTLAPDLYALKNYYSRPYPVTAGLLADVPIFGSMASMLPGWPIGGGIRMHDDEISRSYFKAQMRDMGISSPEIARMYQEGSGGFANLGTASPGYSDQIDTNAIAYERPLSRSQADWAIGESVSNLKDVVGMRGFMLGAAFASITGRSDLYDYAPELANPTDIAGFRRSFWDLSLGGMAGSSEIIRRYIPHRRNQMKVLNPLVNTMPDWVPGKDYMIDFKHGDPYSLVPMGEARLPGPSYETAHDVQLAFPLDAEVFGQEIESQVAYMLGFPEYMNLRNRSYDVARDVADGFIKDAKTYGDLLKESSSVYSPDQDIHATIDGILKDGIGMKMALKVAPKGYGGASTLNAYMVLADIKKGMLLEVDPETGGIEEKLLKQDTLRFESEMSRAKKAQIAAYSQVTGLEKSGKAMSLANSYSWFDRFRILADVGQWSNEYKEAAAIVKQQMLEGKLQPQQISAYKTILDQVERKSKAFESNEYRFMNVGTPLTQYGRDKESIIEQEYSTTERMVGGAWEYLTHLRTPIHSKMMHYTSALEEYENTSIYGKQIKMWENPYEDFVKTYWYRMTSEHDPAQSAISWGIGGYLLGGPAVAGAMAAVGGAIGTVNAMTGRLPVPERTEARREIMEQQDAVKYAKYKRLYSETGDMEYLRKAASTISGSSIEGRILNIDRLGRTLGTPEKNFLQDIIANATSTNLDRVSAFLPKSALPTLYQEIGQPGMATSSLQDLQGRIAEREIPGSESSIYSPNVALESPTIQTFQNEGINAHDSGMGWYNQVGAMVRTQEMGLWNKEDTLYNNRYGTRVTVKDFTSHLDVSTKLRSLLSHYGMVQITDDGESRSDVEIIL